jgi:hypothetical protein
MAGREYRQANLPPPRACETHAHGVVDRKLPRRVGAGLGAYTCVFRIARTSIALLANDRLARSDLVEPGAKSGSLSELSQSSMDFTKRRPKYVLGDRRVAKILAQKAV